MLLAGSGSAPRPRIACDRRRAPRVSPQVPHRIVSIAEAARLTGLTKASIRIRLDSGELRAVRRGGLRRISVDELAERGLLDTRGNSVMAEAPPEELLDRLERQAEEIGRLRVELWLAQRRLDRRERRNSRRP